MPDRYLRWNELDDERHRDIMTYYTDHYGISAEIVFNHRAELYDRIARQVCGMIEAIGAKVSD